MDHLKGKWQILKGLQSFWGKQNVEQVFDVTTKDKIRIHAIPLARTNSTELLIRGATEESAKQIAKLIAQKVSDPEGLQFHVKQEIQKIQVIKIVLVGTTAKEEPEVIELGEDDITLEEIPHEKDPFAAVSLTEKYLPVEENEYNGEKTDLDGATYNFETENDGGSDLGDLPDDIAALINDISSKNGDIVKEDIVQAGVDPSVTLMMEEMHEQEQNPHENETGFSTAEVKGLSIEKVNTPSKKKPTPVEKKEPPAQEGLSTKEVNTFLSDTLKTCSSLTSNEKALIKLLVVGLIIEWHRLRETPGGNSKLKDLLVRITSEINSHNFETYRITSKKPEVQEKNIKIISSFSTKETTTTIKKYIKFLTKLSDPSPTKKRVHQICIGLTSLLK